MKNNLIIKPYYGYDDTTTVKTYKVEDVVNGDIFYIGTYKECNDFINEEYVMGCDPAVEGSDITVMCEYKNSVLNRSYKV